MFGKIGMVILLVSDVHKLITFYRDTLGMKVRHESDEWIELSTKEGSTSLALHLKDLKQAEQTADVKMRTVLLGFNVSDLGNV